MTSIGFCTACMVGLHDEHDPVPKPGTPGLIGSRHECHCEGECQSRERVGRLLGISAPDPHRWVLVADEDPDAHELCVECGAQRNRRGLIAERATITGGWPRTTDCTVPKAPQAKPEAEPVDQTKDPSGVVEKE